MSLKPYFFMLLLIFISSSVSAALLLFYLSPEQDTRLAFSLMTLAVILGGTSFLSMLFFFIKKIYYRGDVTLSTMSASIRQALLIMIGSIMMLVLYGLGIYETRLVLVVWAAIACLEVMIQAVSS